MSSYNPPEPGRPQRDSTLGRLRSRSDALHWLVAGTILVFLAALLAVTFAHSSGPSQGHDEPRLEDCLSLNITLDQQRVRYEADENLHSDETLLAIVGHTSSLQIDATLDHSCSQQLGEWTLGTELRLSALLSDAEISDGTSVAATVEMETASSKFLLKPLQEGLLALSLGVTFTGRPSPDFDPQIASGSLLLTIEAVPDDRNAILTRWLETIAYECMQIEFKTPAKIDRGKTVDALVNVSCSSGVPTDTLDETFSPRLRVQIAPAEGDTPLSLIQQEPAYIDLTSPEVDLNLERKITLGAWRAQGPKHFKLNLSLALQSLDADGSYANLVETTASFSQGIQVNRTLVQFISDYVALISSLVVGLVAIVGPFTKPGKRLVSALAQLVADSENSPQEPPDPSDPGYL